MASSPALPPAEQGRPLGFRQDQLRADHVRDLCAGRPLTTGMRGVVEGPGLGSGRPRHAVERARLIGRWGCFTTRNGTAGGSAWRVRLTSRKALRCPSPGCARPSRSTRKPQRGTAYVNALGYYELYVNGKKVDDYVLAPAVVDYSKRNWYLTHDITDYLVQGRNTVALWLGRGWYVRGHPGVVYDGPMVRAQFEIVAAGWQAGESGNRPHVEGQSQPDHPDWQGHGIRRLRRRTLRCPAGSGRLERRQAGRFGMGGGGCVRSAEGDDLGADGGAQPHPGDDQAGEDRADAGAAGGSSTWARTTPAGWNCACRADIAAGKNLKIEFADNPPARAAVTARSTSATST